MNMTLRELGVGSSGRVVQVGGERVLRHRLLEMGITPRTVVTVKKIAPMGDPVELFLRGYSLTLRLEDAKNIVIEEIVNDVAGAGDERGAAA
ncbi:MAG: ferrous iron transport protein A [Chitinispirillia bacterium]|nr:ferrous iron transport protein A [Chitinispirillia bacterium]MCL2242213.1 ferrous iron transport protein A [Chitinispirillia bacterium]